jgi:hypothetical protein
MEQFLLSIYGIKFGYFEKRDFLPVFVEHCKLSPKFAKELKDLLDKQ